MQMKQKVLTVFLVVVAFWRFFLPGPKVANDFPLISNEELLSRFSLPQAWLERSSEGLGQYFVPFLWFWPMDLIFGFAAKLGLGFEQIEKFLLIIPIILLGSWSIRRFLSYYKIGGWANFVGSLFYLLNTYIILIIDGGQFAIALSYIFLPIAFIEIKKSYRFPVRQKVLAGLIVGVLSFLDPRFVYILALLVALDFIYGFLILKVKVKSYIFRAIASWLVSAMVVTGLNMYWLLPGFFGGGVLLPETYGRLSQASFLSFADLGHGLLVLQPHWFKNVFGQVTSLRPEFYLIPILVFLAPVLRRKSRVVGFWLFTALISVFLVKGTNEPLGEVYSWLFINVPGFSLFRDPTKFFILVTLSYSMLIGVTVTELEKRIKWKPILIPLLLTAYLLILISPVWSGRMTGTLNEPYNKSSFNEVSRILEQDKDFGRVLWIPSVAPLGYSSPTHPSMEASRIFTKRPFSSGNVGTYETFNFLREASFMGQIFDILGIKYIAYPYPNIRREELKQDNVDYYNNFLNQMINLPWVEGRFTEIPTPLLKVKNSQERFFTSSNGIFMVGSERFYNDAANLDDFKLPENSLVFTEGKPGILSRYFENDGLWKILVYDKDNIDVAGSLIQQKYFIDVTKSLNFEPSANSRWWKRESSDFLWWRNFLQTKYDLDDLEYNFGFGYAISEGKNQLLISNDKFLKGNILLARVMRTSKGGKLEFSQCGRMVGEVDTINNDPKKVQNKLSGYGGISDQIFEYEKAKFSWYEVGELDDCQDLRIDTAGEINVINSLAVLPKSEWSTIKQNVANLDGSGKLIFWENLTMEERRSVFNYKFSDSKVDYLRVSPTKYKVKVEGLERPELLVFSEAYDSRWQLRGYEAVELQMSLPVFGMLNGFWLFSDGEYDVYFTPQRNVEKGLLVSGATLVVTLISLILLRKRAIKKV